MFAYLGQILEQSLLMFPLVLGIYVSFTVLKIADLSVDGTFVLGAAVFAKLSTAGLSLFASLAIAILSGLASGALAALVQQKNRIDPLIAGILVAFVLHSASLVIMQRPNIGLLSANMMWSSPSQRLVVLAIFFVVLFIGASLFLSRRLGLWLKAFGNNPDLVAMLGKSPERLRTLGLSLANGLAALSGCLTAQASGYADVNMGLGQALIGIAMILIGRQLLHLFSKKDLIHDGLGVIFAMVGVVFYFVLTNEVIRYGLSPVYLKMAIGLLLITFLLLFSDRAVHRRSTLS